MSHSDLSLSFPPWVGRAYQQYSRELYPADPWLGFWGNCFNGAFIAYLSALDGSDFVRWNWPHGVVGSGATAIVYYWDELLGDHFFIDKTAFLALYIPITAFIGIGGQFTPYL